MEVLAAHDPARIVTLGGECAVSVAPFAQLAHCYGDDLAIVWIDSHPDEIVLGPGAEPDGLTGAQVRRVVDDIDSAADIVAMTVAEFIPRQVMHLQQILADFPLLRPFPGGTSKR